MKFAFVYYTFTSLAANGGETCWNGWCYFPCIWRIWNRLCRLCFILFAMCVRLGLYMPYVIYFPLLGTMLLLDQLLSQLKKLVKDQALQFKLLDQLLSFGQQRGIVRWAGALVKVSVLKSVWVPGSSTQGKVERIKIVQGRANLGSKVFKKEQNWHI